MAKKKAGIGEAVLFDGNMHLIVDTMERYAQERKELVTLVIFENPAVKVTGMLEDLRWDAEMGCWYMWGRALAKSDRAVVAELRDRGLLSARRTRNPGNAPAGGEHLNLYKTLFRSREQGFLDAALTQVRSGGDLPGEAVTAVAEYGTVFKQKLSEGYADPDANDSEGEDNG